MDNVSNDVRILQNDNGKSYPFSRALTIVAGIVLFCLTFVYKAFNVEGSYIALSLIPIACVMIDSLYVKDKSEYDKFSNLYTGILYIAVPIALTNFAAFDAAQNFSGLVILNFFILIWSTDVGAYCWGTALGQKYGKKLFPSISPKKSWIGFWGGFGTSIIVAIILSVAGLLDLCLWKAALLGAIIAIASVYGDLIESQWKRHYAIKDSGNGIPGHGGYLDRFDSALLALPIGIIFMELIALL